jgi:hypothetical protein
MNKIVQFQVTEGRNTVYIYVLCEDGTLWVKEELDRAWVPVKGTVRGEEDGPL